MENTKHNREACLEIVKRKKFQIGGSIQEEEVEAECAEIRAWLGISMGSVWWSWVGIHVTQETERSEQRKMLLSPSH